MERWHETKGAHTRDPSYSENPHPFRGAAPDDHQSGHFYFAQTGHSHFAATTPGGGLPGIARMRYRSE